MGRGFESSEGSGKAPHVGAFPFRRTCSSPNGRPTGRATRDCCAAERPARIERVFVRAGAVASLNDDQAAAATAPPERPLLIIAGAGTGKTQTLMARVAWLVEQGVRPERPAR